MVMYIVGMILLFAMFDVILYGMKKDSVEGCKYSQIIFVKDTKECVINMIILYFIYANTPSCLIFVWIKSD